jgi:transposase-like protein
MRDPFRHFNSSPQVIRMTVMMYIHYPLSLGNAADQDCGRCLNNRAENSHQPFRRR